MIGIVDAHDFRKRVFDQRDKVTDNMVANEPSSDSMIEVLNDIGDSIKTIEKKLSEN